MPCSPGPPADICGTYTPAPSTKGMCTISPADGCRAASAVPRRFYPLPGVVLPRVAAIRNDNVLSIHEPGGTQTARYDFSGKVHAVAPHPAGEGVVIVFEPMIDEELRQDRSYGGVRSPRAASICTPRSSTVPPATRVCRWHALATSGWCSCTSI